MDKVGKGEEEKYRLVKKSLCKSDTGIECKVYYLEWYKKSLSTASLSTLSSLKTTSVLLRESVSSSRTSVSGSKISSVMIVKMNFSVLELIKHKIDDHSGS